MYGSLNKCDVYGFMIKTSKKKKYVYSNNNNAKKTLKCKKSWKKTRGNEWLIFCLLPAHLCCNFFYPKTHCRANIIPRVPTHCA